MTEPKATTNSPPNGGFFLFGKNSYGLDDAHKASVIQSWN